MNYSDYFADKVAASLTSDVSVVVVETSTGSVELVKQLYRIPESLVATVLEYYQDLAYKINLSANEIKVFTYGRPSQV